MGGVPDLAGYHRWPLTGTREALGFDVGDSEDGASRTIFLRLLKARALHDLQLVISDTHAGLKIAIASARPGAAAPRQDA